MLKPLKQKLK